MKTRAAELKAAARGGRGAKKAAADEAAVLSAIAAMAEPDRALAERVHAIVTDAAPELAPKLWYGQPAYAKAGKVVCFFRSGQGDKERYSTLGFSVEANLDEDDGMWPTAYALTKLTEAGEAAIRKLVQKAVR
ncbi:iron chaperone [Nonomuraea sp. NPDC050328]